MTNEATFEKMKLMKLNGMLNAFRTTTETGCNHDFTPDELVGHLVDAEWEDRYNRKLTRLLKTANFRFKATVEQINFQAARGLDKNLIHRLSTCDWINKAENVLLTGH